MTEPVVTETKVPTNKLGLVRKDYVGSASTMCPGCGHDAITSAVINACFDLGIDQKMVIKMSGIGCSSKTPAYFLPGSHAFNSVHGRMPSVATGAVLANRNLKTIAVSGDGDTASIGIGQFIHLLRRNVPMIYVMENNGVYGLTKGQFSATADVGSKLKSGIANEMEPVDCCTLAIQLGCSYVVRSFSGDPKQLVPLLKGAFSHHGTALLDVISPCVTFNNHEGSSKSFKAVRDHDISLHQIGFVMPQETITMEQEPGTVQEVKMHDGSMLRLRSTDRKYDPTDKGLALRTLAEAASKQELLTGLIYVNEQSKDFLEMLKLSETPLAQLGEKELRPSRADLQKVIDELR